MATSTKLKRKTPKTIYDITRLEMSMWRKLIDVPVYAILAGIAMKSKLSQKELSLLFDCNRKTISHWLTGGRKPELGYKALLDVRAYILDVDAEYCRHATEIAKLQKTISLRETISELLNAGYTYMSIAMEIGVSRKTVRSWHLDGTPTSLFPSLRLYNLYHSEFLAEDETDLEN